MRSLVLTVPILLLAFGVFYPAVFQTTAVSAEALDQDPKPPAKFKPYKYKTHKIQGWTVLVQKELQAKTKLRTEVLNLLNIQLWRINQQLPEEVTDRLQEVILRVHLNREGNPGAVYHPSEEWLRDNGFPKDWAGGVEFGNAENFLTWSQQQPMMTLHELSHAWHHQVLGYDHEGILEALQDVRLAKSFESVTRFDGGKEKHYALSNEMEFFAEMSEAWWGHNDFYPFVRGELVEDFPAIPPLMRACWQLPKK